MRLKTGDRVRVITPDSGYTGCRGTIVEDPHAPAAGPDEASPLGHYVAIDGENGIARPFLTRELESLLARGARPAAAERRQAR